MKGDVLIIGDHHRKAARQSYELIRDEIRSQKGKYTLTVAGESGAGKSEIAASLAELLIADGIDTFIFQQDDYFKLPPKSNASARKEDIEHVGMHEVKLDLLDQHLKMALQGAPSINKPLVIFDDDLISEETVDISNTRVFIAEGTYTTSLGNANLKIFIDRNINDTKASRLKRNREVQDEFLEKILEIEHKIISAHKDLADIIITKEYEAYKP
jgi:uridine kinase